MDTAEIRAELADKERRLRTQLAELTKPVEAGATIGFGKRIGDGTSQAISQMEDASSASAVNALLEQVIRAKGKLSDETYGRCDVCHQPIGEERLEFRPWSTTCIEHAG